MAKRWKYAVEDLSHFRGSGSRSYILEQEEKLLNPMGEEGWELVRVVEVITDLGYYDKTAYLKREIR